MAQDAEKLAAQAERLRGLKEVSRVKFKAIAEAVGVTERQVQRWFAGDSDIEVDNLKELARFFGTTPDYIEYGVFERAQGKTPALLGPDRTQQLDRIEAAIKQLRTELENLRVEVAESVSEVMTRVDEVSRRVGPPRRRQQP